MDTDRCAPPLALSGGNHRKIVAWRNDLRTANQCSEETIQLFQVHRTLITKTCEERAHAIQLCFGQWLQFHGATSMSLVPFKHCRIRKSLAHLRSGVWVGGDCRGGYHTKRTISSH